jgi:DNA primase
LAIFRKEIMARFIDESLLDEIRTRSNIVEIISSYVALKPSGSNYKGLCPFHSEKTPSFMVSPEREIFHCFGCGVGGNVFSFIMKMEGLSFSEAVRFLAEKQGLQISRSTPPTKEEGKRQNFFALNQLATNFFKQQLYDSRKGEKARAYLQARGVSPEIIRLFQLGYAGEEWDGLTKYFTHQGIALESALEVGLLKKTDNGRYYDLFRNRIIFPIFDVWGRIIGFGGRWIGVEEEKSPKYINTPETLLYKKSNNLYGLNFAREGIRKEGLALIVEGYFDLITLVQNEISNVVASLGTALTNEQLQILRRYTNKIILVFDGDSAGKMAVLRKATPIVESNFWVKVLPLPPGEDPDSFLKKYGREAFLSEKDQALPYLQYLINITLEDKGFSSLEEKLNSLDILLPLLGKVSNKVEQASYLSFLAEKIKVPMTALLTEMKKKTPSPQVIKDTHRTVNLTMPKPDKQISAEQELIRLILIDEDLLSSLQQVLSIYTFKDPDLGEIAQALLKAYEEGYRSQKLWDKALATLPMERQKSLLSQFLIAGMEYDDKTKALADCLKIIDQKRLSQANASAIEHMYKEAIATKHYEEYDKFQRRYIENFR